MIFLLSIFCSFVLAKTNNCLLNPLPASIVNDDFCDCPNGIDEPLTSACSPIGFFECKNSYFKPPKVYKIPSSRVNDGICDPECCDGSDELNRATNITPCPNICKQSFLNSITELVELKKGTAKRLEYINQTKALSLNRVENIQILSKEVESLQLEKTNLEDVEKNMKIDENICSPFLDYYIGVLEATIMAARELKNTKNFNNLNINYPEPLKVQIMSSEAHPPTTDANDESFDVDSKIEFESDEEFDYMNFKDPESIELVNHIHICQKYLDTITQFTKDIQIKTNEIDIRSVEEPREIINYKRKLVTVNSDISKKQAKLEDMKQRNAIDFGANNVFEILYKKCFTFSESTYTYNICFFGEAEQKTKDSTTSLGKWDRWSGPDQNKYSEMIFENGASCFKAPNRSLKVKLKCGVEDKIAQVSEPNICAYEIVFETPAACDESLLKEFEAIHDEL